MGELDRVLRERGFSPVRPAVGNFLFVDVGEDAAALNDALLRRGVIVRPMGKRLATPRLAGLEVELQGDQQALEDPHRPQ